MTMLSKGPNELSENELKGDKLSGSDCTSYTKIYYFMFTSIYLFLFLYFKTTAQTHYF